MTQPRTSRHRFRRFLQDSKARRLDEQPGSDTPAPDDAPRNLLRRWLQSGPRRDYLRGYLAWLKPHRSAVAIVFTLALIAAGLQMVEPLFMRFIVDRVLLNRALTNAERIKMLNMAGGLFPSVVVVNKRTAANRD